MKKFSIIAVFVFVYLFSAALCSPAMAEQKKKYWFYDQFTMQTPDNWTVEKNKQVVTLFNADKSASINIMVVDPVVESSREFAAAIFSSVFDKFKDLDIKDVGDGLLSFTYEWDGVTWRSIVGVIVANGIVINVTGDDPDIEESLKSIKLKLTFTSSAWKDSADTQK